MNDLEKKSFYSFLALYIISSFIFISGIGYWYYKAQKSALENEMYYKLQHLSDMKSGDIIMAHMQNKPLKRFSVPKGITLALINTKGAVVEGRLLDPTIREKEEGYFFINGYQVLISDTPREHLNIAYVVAQSDTLSGEVAELKSNILQVLMMVSFFIVLVAVLLSKLFMRPVRERVEQIERFINDVTHELNTPITSLSMATNQALRQGSCSEKTMKNISISTKQLFDIYRSLTYLNFSSKKDISEPLNLKETLEKSVAYYTSLAEIKRIKFDVVLEDTLYTMPESQATLLFGNLIGNAIKYSSPKSNIFIGLKDSILTITDEGIGIDTSKQKEIFEKFKRGTEYSGGFGVGLSIVKSICDAYGIKITLESELNEGTTFRLNFV